MPSKVVIIPDNIVMLPGKVVILSEAKRSRRTCGSQARSDKAADRRETGCT